MANQNGWDTVGNETQGNNNGGRSPEDKLDFLAVSVGDTKIRILDEVPYAYQEWWAVKGNGGDGTSIPYKGKEDLLDKANREFMQGIFKKADEKGLKDKARKKFLKDEGYEKQPYGKLKSKYIIHVLDRTTGEVKLLDKGQGIFGELKKYAMNNEYGDLRNYDVTITMTKKGETWRDIEYSVTPARSNTPLTDEEKALYEAKKVDLAELKGGEHITPEQAYEVAKGATWKDVLGAHENPEEPAQEDFDPTKTVIIKPEDNPAYQPQVDVSKEGALSDEELKGIKF
ncbi:phosphoesterase [Bacillus wiedmannii]|uniref:phosphoesterase n=1 Tax=Bacillus wiedmannii TaxID=1890302 RepID=UPI000BF05F5C|nr:phosphoesterase [Bacillus wiedmannii]PEM30167.1 phosphoesterase [Bacillus wiedmannii]